MDSVFAELPVINMLNTKYIILDLNNAPLQNPHPLGNAWFVSDFKMVGTADDEIEAMKNFNPAETAIVNQQFISQVQGLTLAKDEAGKIELTGYQPNSLTYDFSASTKQLTVFSDIYYDKGWNAYIDGEPVPHFRVNYVLRALIIPEGKHTIEFRFEPKSYYAGNKVSLASSLLLVLAALGYGFSIRRKGISAGKRAGAMTLRLPADFFQRNVLEVASGLPGKFLCAIPATGKSTAFSLLM